MGTDEEVDSDDEQADTYEKIIPEFGTTSPDFEDTNNNHNTTDNNTTEITHCNDNSNGKNKNTDNNTSDINDGSGGPEFVHIFDEEIQKMDQSTLQTELKLRQRPFYGNKSDLKSR